MWSIYIRLFFNILSLHHRKILRINSWKCFWNWRIVFESFARGIRVEHLRDEAKRASIGLFLPGLSIRTSITGSVATNTTDNTSPQMTGG